MGMGLRIFQMEIVIRDIIRMGNQKGRENTFGIMVHTFMVHLWMDWDLDLGSSRIVSTLIKDFIKMIGNMVMGRLDIVMDQCLREHL